MNWKNTIALIALMLGFSFNFKAEAQCAEIESILVDACGVQEGLNEMVRFRVGNTALSISDLNADWPNNAWQGLLQNSVTAAKTAALNADILDAGGCGQLIEPLDGILPANARVILVTSFNLDTPLNQFGPITEDFYILYQNNSTVTGGHFANSGTGLRTLSISFGSCIDTVTYNRALLISPTGATVPADGATVLFSPDGTPTYINNGCSAPVPPFTVEAGNAISACAGSTVTLNGQAQGQQSVQWSAAGGSFSDANSLTTTYTIDPQATGSIILVLANTNACGATISDAVTINITSSVTPDFPVTLALCSGQTAPALSATSPNGVSGSWSPPVISNTQSGTYVFTPAAGQCASPVTLSVTVAGSIVPDFATQLALCANSVPPVLATVSPNGVSGSWSPPVISNTQSGTYVFTPAAGQCASPVTLSVTVAGSIVPDFATQLALCANSVPPVLATVSPNGVSGSWSPSVIDTASNGTYVFTPNSGQCAQSVVLQVTVTSQVTPDFPSSLTLCASSEVPVLATTSPNGISGSWNPAAIDASQSGNYVFTPNPGQCASPVTLTVTLSQSTTPDFPTGITLCSGSEAPVLETVSPNGISGSWNPPSISTQQSAAYIFTPNPNQCAGPVTLTVAIEETQFSIEQGCVDGQFMVWVESGQDFAEYQWTDAGGAVLGSDPELDLSGLAESEQIIFPASFQLTVTTGTGCSYEQEVTVSGILCIIPKGISPNGDSLNDTFDLAGYGVSELKIYNRYGVEVYGRRNYTDQWHGQSGGGKELPDATYYYAITTSAGKVRTGWVYLIREE